MFAKHTVDDLALFGGPRQFATPKPVSNLARPDFDCFIDHIDTALRFGNLTSGGQACRELEERLARFHEVAHCVTFNSGFWALALLFRITALPGKREVVMPSLTYRRMSDIAAWAGLTPRFCDIDPVGLTNTAEQVYSCITSDTGLLLGVHPICGIADIDGLAELADRHGLPLVFDSVESVHERHLDKKIGSFGLAEVFSLGASKLINGFEGGYITTGDASLAGRLRDILAQDSRSGWHFNARLPDLHAAMALASLDDLPNQIARNKARYDLYLETFKNLDGMRVRTFAPETRPSYKNILVELLPNWPLSRDDTVRLLNAELALARAYYPQPLHLRPMAYPHVSTPLPNTEQACDRYILMPCGELVSSDDIHSLSLLLRFILDHRAAINEQLASQESGHVH